MIDQNKPVRVFRNWKHGCYSIFQDGCLRASARQIRLHAVEFRVRESGRQRMLRERRRNVHAFAVGRLVDWVHPNDERCLDTIAGRGVRYDPYRFPTFVDRDTGAPVLGADVVQFDEAGVTYAAAGPTDLAA